MPLAERHLPHEARLVPRNLQEAGREARSSFAPGERSQTLATEVPQEQLRFVVVLCVALAGYVFFDRPFAYLRVPGTPVFVGELVLALGLLTVLRSNRALLAVRRSAALQVLLLLMALGLAQLLWDVPEHGLAALRDAAIWYYGLFAFVVAGLLRASPGLLAKLVQWYRAAIPWYLVWAPVAVVLSRSFGEEGPRLPGTETALLGFKTGNIAVHAALAVSFLWLWDEAVTPTQRRRRLILTGAGLTTVLFAGTTNRGGLVSAAVVLIATPAFAQRPKAMLGAVFGCLVVVVSFFLATDLRLQQEGRDVSLEQIVDNVSSLVGVEVGDEDSLNGTVEWRVDYWSEVAVDVVDGTAGPFGYGFGSSLADRYGFQVVSDDSDQPLRNAHNSHLTLLARMGLGGFALWVALWGAWFATLAPQARAARSMSDPRGGLAAWLLLAAVGILLNAVFDPTLEGPQVAIWLWTLFGIGCALPSKRSEGTANPRVASSTGAG